MNNLKDELVDSYNKVVDKKDSSLQDFKNGVADAMLISDAMRRRKEKTEDKKPHSYHHGYDFGLAMYRRLFKEHEE
jgi:hypothetical protein